jgi:hypothetical protein
MFSHESLLEWAIFFLIAAYYKELYDFNNWKQENYVSGVSGDLLLYFFNAKKKSCFNFNSNFMYYYYFLMFDKLFNSLQTV